MGPFKGYSLIYTILIRLLQDVRMFPKPPSCPPTPILKARKSSRAETGDRAHLACTPLGPAPIRCRCPVGRKTGPMTDREGSKPEPQRAETVGNGDGAERGGEGMEGSVAEWRKEDQRGAWRARRSGAGERSA